MLFEHCCHHYHHHNYHDYLNHHYWYFIPPFAQNVAFDVRKEVFPKTRDIYGK